jgi:hypothetical protein
VGVEAARQQVGPAAGDDRQRGDRTGKRLGRMMKHPFGRGEESRGLHLVQPGAHVGQVPGAPPEFLAAMARVLIQRAERAAPDQQLDIRGVHDAPGSRNGGVKKIVGRAQADGVDGRKTTGGSGGSAHDVSCRAGLCGFVPAVTSSRYGNHFERTETVTVFVDALLDASRHSTRMV